MARGRGVDRRGRSKKMAPFVALDRQMLRSSVYRGLTPMARSVQIALADGFTGSNNGHIRFGARDGEAWGIGRTRTAQALRELEAVRLITATLRGGFSYKKRHVSEWWLHWLPGAAVMPEAFRENVGPQNAPYSPDVRTVAPKKAAKRAV